MNVLVFLKLNDLQKNKLEKVIKASFVYTSNKDVKKDDLRNADIIIGNPSRKYLVECKHLKLLQLSTAGSDTYCETGVLPSGCILCNASGTFGVAIAEHNICVLLMMMKKMKQYLHNQDHCLWNNEGKIDSIYGSNILILGMGDLGSESAKRFHALGAHVYGIRAHQTTIPDYMEDVQRLDQLENLLPKMDVVINCLPNHPQTFHIMKEETISLMKHGSYLINVGRGTAVDLDVLLAHLQSHHLAGAALDVFEEEPLPENHRAWKEENLIITPHISGTWNLASSIDKFVDIACHNLSHLCDGEECLNVVDEKSGYRMFKEK
ncbi:MAG: D-2-hydroxyacid dehydrogenase [Erysipelotrichaceae bacterium]